MHTSDIQSSELFLSFHFSLIGLQTIEVASAFGMTQAWNLNREEISPQGFLMSSLPHAFVTLSEQLQHSLGRNSLEEHSRTQELTSLGLRISDTNS